MVRREQALSYGAVNTVFGNGTVACFFLKFSSASGGNVAATCGAFDMPIAGDLYLHNKLNLLKMGFPGAIPSQRVRKVT